jgi:hypothetical protein
MPRLLLLSMLLLSASASAQKVVTLSWTPGSNPGWTETCTTNSYCLTGYTLYEMTSGAPVAVASIGQNSTTVSITPPPPVGVHVYTVVQNGLNSAGAAVQSTCNPSIVLNCLKNSYGRTCRVGQSW